MKYTAYCRKLIDEKDKQVLSIDQQISELKDFVSGEKLEIVDFYYRKRICQCPRKENIWQLNQTY